MSKSTLEYDRFNAAMDTILRAAPKTVKAKTSFPILNVAAAALSLA